MKVGLILRVLLVDFILGFKMIGDCGNLLKEKIGVFIVICCGVGVKSLGIRLRVVKFWLRISWVVNCVSGKWVILFM